MTLVYPRSMPPLGVMAQTFELQRVDYLSPEASGRLGAVAAGTPIWVMTLDLNNLFEEADEWRAFVAGQRGGLRRFYGYDLDRRVPRFAAAGRTFVPAPTSWSQAIAGDGTAYLTLGGCNRGQIVSPGDYVGFVWGGWKRALVRAIERAATAADGSVTFAVEPAVPVIGDGGGVVPDEATVTLKQPEALFRLDTAKTQLGKQALGYMAAGGTITAIQDLVA